MPPPTMEQRCFTLTRDPRVGTATNSETDSAAIKLAASRQLHGAGVNLAIGIGCLRRSSRGTLTGLTSPTSTAAMLMTQRYIVLRATFTTNPGHNDLKNTSV